MKYLQSYQSKILLSFFGFTLVLACWSYFKYKVDLRNDKLEMLATRVNDQETGYLTQTRHLQNFLLYGFHQSEFYTRGTQPDIDAFETYLKNNHRQLAEIRLQIQKSGMNVNTAIDTLAAENQKLVQFLINLKTLYQLKGYKDFGTEGKMRFYAHILEDSLLIPEISLLQLRRNEKDFLLRGEESYANTFLKLADSLISKYQSKTRAREVLQDYKKNFTALVGYNKKIGIYSSDGLYNVIQAQLINLDNRYVQLCNVTNTAVISAKIENNFFLYTGTIIFFLLVIFTIWRLSKYLTKEIKDLNEIVLKFIHSGFNEAPQNDRFNPKILEVITLHRSFKLLKQKLKNMLEEKASHQKMLVTAMIDGQEKERRNIGVELHDNINPMLATSKMYLCVARDNEDERLQMIQTSSEIIEETLSEIRKLSHGLVGPPSSEFLLQESLKDLVTTVEVGATFEISFTSNDFDESQLSESKKLTLYRIVQEQLNNVIKYASAKNVIVSLLERQHELLLSIKDNGIGFDRTKKTNGIGLRNIETRLELVNGIMLLNTSPGNGCEMNISVPM